jgi:hypothetical protein
MVEGGGLACVLDEYDVEGRSRADRCRGPKHIKRWYGIGYGARVRTFPGQTMHQVIHLDSTLFYVIRAEAN